MTRLDQSVVLQVGRGRFEVGVGTGAGGGVRVAGRGGWDTSGAMLLLRRLAALEGRSLVMRRKPRWIVPVVLMVFGFVTVLDVSLLGAEEGEAVAEVMKSHGDGDNGAMRFLVVTDMDKLTKRGKSWIAYLRRGELYDPLGAEPGINWTDEDYGAQLESKKHEDGRAMELSELVHFNGKMLSGDDHTGIVYEVHEPHKGTAHVQAWVTIHDADGKNDDPFKIEWMVVKDDLLYIGTHGREVTSKKGKIKNYNRMWVKTVNKHGKIKNYDWTDRYNWLREQVGASFPGYLVHETVLWNDDKREWIFLPRRYSHDVPYTDEDSEKRGWNHALVVDEDFTELRADIKFEGLELGERGFSSASFVPGSDNNRILALRTVEHDAENSFETYISMLELNSTEVVLPETFIYNLKYEGVTFSDLAFD
mmetsp:Transcript_11502/g.35122  ORF Transcript_11502/g.35122 Transcript_11502/m.35122 type:complete len:420 (+) Transcript_11502:49-1308(+)